MENTRRFDGMAGLYSRYRPGYPPEVAQWVMNEARLSAASRVADVGSGTGLLTELFLNAGLRVYAIEPNPDMRTMAERKLEGRIGFISVAAIAEETGLKDQSVDLVSAAQAFHWFNQELFANECRRILKPGGLVALLWNSFDEDSALMLEYYKLLQTANPSYTRTPAPLCAVTPEKAAFFAGGPPQCRVFDNHFECDEESFVGWALSSSYAPKPGAATYEPYVRGMQALFRKYARGGVVKMPNVTECFLGRV